MSCVELLMKRTNRSKEMIGVQRDPSLGHVSLNPHLHGRIIKPPAYLLTLLSSFACDRNPAGTKTNWLPT